MAKEISTILLDDLVQIQGDRNPDDQKVLMNLIDDIVGKQQKLQFFIPAFPSKISTKEEKGGVHPERRKDVPWSNPDYVELLAVKTLVQCARRLEEVYDGGIEFILLLDYYTEIKPILEISDSCYELFENQLMEVIYQLGGHDVIKLVSLKQLDSQEMPVIQLSGDINGATATSVQIQICLR